MLVAIRRDLIDRVFRVLREEGAMFQEEKYHSRYLPCIWTPSSIIAVLDERIDELVARRYQKNRRITHRDVTYTDQQNTHCRVHYQTAPEDPVR